MPITVTFDLVVSVTSVTGNNPQATSGGRSVTINGENFVSGATVTIGSTSATNVVFVNAAQLTANAPAKAAGSYDVVVTNPGGQNGTCNICMTYRTPPTVTSVTPNNNLDTMGGQTITVVGTDLAGNYANGVKVDATLRATSGSANSEIFTTPAHAAGAVTLRVYGTSGSDANGIYTDYSPFTFTATAPDTSTTSCPDVRDGGGNQAACASGGGAAYGTRSVSASFGFVGTDDPETPIGPFTYTCKLFNNVSNALLRTDACNSGAMSYTSANLSAGNTYRFEVAATDSSSLSDSSPATFIWSVQPNLPPTITSFNNTAMGFDPFIGNLAAFSFTATDPAPVDNPMNYICELKRNGVNQAVPSPCTTDNSGAVAYFNAGPLLSGDYTFRVRARDGLGAEDVNAWSSTFSWSIPSAVVVSGPSGVVAADTSTFTLRGDDADVGTTITAFKCSIDSGAYADCNVNPAPPAAAYAPVTYTSPSLPNGLHTLNVRVSDNQGNVSTNTLNWTWTIFVPPAVITSIGANGIGSDLKIGSDGLARLSYIDDVANKLMFIKCNNATCTSPAPVIIDDVDSAAKRTSLAMKLNGAGDPAISYPGPGAILRYAEFVIAGGTGCSNTTAWTCTTVDSGLVNSHNSLVFSGASFDVPLIFYKKSGSGLRAANRSGTVTTPCPNAAWHCEPMGATTGDGVVAAMGSNGLPSGLAYTTSISLQSFWCSNSFCTGAGSKSYSTLDSSWVAGCGPGPNEAPAHSRDVGNRYNAWPTGVSRDVPACSGTRNINYRQPGAAINVIIDGNYLYGTAGPSPFGLSIDYGADGSGGKKLQGIFYSGRSNSLSQDKLAFFYCTDTSCSTATQNFTLVDNMDTNEHWVSLKIDTNGIPIMTYNNNNTLYYARCNRALCQ